MQGDQLVLLVDAPSGAAQDMARERGIRATFGRVVNGQTILMARLADYGKVLAWWCSSSALVRTIGAPRRERTEAPAW